LSIRIRNLPRVPLIHDAPKRMSVAGAQHKLLVVFDGERLYEPLPGDVSTHLLKPNHPDDTYSNSVINEYFAMRLAHAVKLPVPRVFRRYVPEPVYLVERFDRVRDENTVRRLHVIDSCQLLNRARSFKYAAARLDSLHAIADACRSPAAARLWLYRWLVFNLLVGNADNHLKNISAMVSAAGIELAPAYDLLSTAVYGTRAFNEQFTWPNIELALPLPGATHFDEVTREHVRSAAAELGVPRQIAERELDRLITTLPTAARSLISAIEAENARWPEPARANFAGELRLLRAVERVVLADMVQRLN
jgi:serine/threonine-protein kinase HipA